MGGRPFCRDFAKRSRFECRPFPRVDQFSLDRLSCERWDSIGCMGAKIDGFRSVNLNDERQKGTLCPSINLYHFARSWRCVIDAGVLLIGQKDLSFLHPIAHLDFHRWLQPMEIAAKNGNLRGREFARD